jgi:hypothetical protein
MSSALLWLGLLLTIGACTPVAVHQGTSTPADVAASRGDGSALNLLSMGVAGADGRIFPRPTGGAVDRGSTVTVGVVGPGIAPGTAIGVLAVGFGIRPIRFTTTQGGSGPIPAAVLSLTVPSDARPGLYSIVAVRGTELSVLSGVLEVR